MNTGKMVFPQVMDFLPLHTFRRYVRRYPSSYPTKTFSHLDQFLCMAFAQLTFRESLLTELTYPALGKWCTK